MTVDLCLNEISYPIRSDQNNCIGSYAIGHGERSSNKSATHG